MATDGCMAVLLPDCAPGAQDGTVPRKALASARKSGSSSIIELEVEDAEVLAGGERFVREAPGRDVRQVIPQGSPCGVSDIAFDADKMRRLLEAMGCDVVSFKTFGPLKPIELEGKTEDGTTVIGLIMPYRLRV
jgi:hypothetical protein